MKILYFSTPSYADCDFPLVKKFSDKGHDVTYVLDLIPDLCNSTLFNIKKMNKKVGLIPAASYSELDVYKDYINLDKVYILNHPFVYGKPFKNIYIQVIAAYKLLKFVIRKKFDVLHSDRLFTYILSVLYWLRKPWIITLHDPFPHSGEHSGRVEKFKRIAFKHCNHFILLNQNQVSQFCKEYKIKPSSVKVNQLGVYECLLSFKKGGWAQKKKNVLFFGRISPYKGVEYLCDAMVKVQEAVPEATVTIAGKGKMYFDDSRYLELPYFKFLNRFITIEELAQMVYESSIVVCPYTDATQSGVIMTAFAMCKPVVATNVGGLGEMIDNGKSGILVEPRNSEQLADAIIRLLSDENEMNKMVSYINNNYYHSERSWDAIADKYIEYYQDCISNNW